MAKPAERPYSRYSQDAVSLLGTLIRRGRLERRITLGELAERAGISRGLAQRIEKGDLGCTIGAVFEAAAIVGVHLFDADQAGFAKSIAANEAALALLPKTIRVAKAEVKDDF